MTAEPAGPVPPVTLEARPVFSAQGVVFTVADVARSARSGGRGPISGHAAARTPALVEESFRRARGLLTADALEAWLASWEIPAEEFRAWTQDTAAGTTLASSWCALVCSGRFDQLSSGLLHAAAAACELGAAPQVAASFDPTGWVDRLLARERTEAALADTLHRHRLAWTRVRSVIASSSERAVLEELRHQVLVDRRSLPTAGAGAGLAAAEHDETLDAYPAAIRAHLSGAQAGELVGPVPADRAWTLVQVLSRSVPSLADPSTRARAEAVVGHEVVAAAVARHVVSDAPPDR